MTSALISKENSEAKFTMTFTAEEFDAATDAAYKATKGRYSVDGFRKGKAPRSMIEKWYGEGVFFNDAIDTLLNSNYPKALDELDIEPISSPDIKFSEEKIEKHKGFTVTVTVQVVPEFEVKDYKGIKADRPVHKVTDEDVERELGYSQKKNARLIKRDGAAENGDTVILDYAGFCGEDQFAGGTAENQSLKLGSGTFIPGFEEQLVGCKAGDDKDVNVTFPNEYHEESLAGKDATFKCHIHEVKYEQLPELDDEFAKDVSEFDTLDEYKADLRKKLEESAEKAAEYSGKDAVIKKLVELNPIAVPAVMIEDEAQNMLQEFAQQMAYQNLTLKDYCKFLGKKESELADEFKPQAEERLRARLTVDAVAKAEGMTVSQEELDAEYANMAAQYGLEVDKLKTMLIGEGNEKYVKQDILNRKAIDFLYANAELTDKEEEPATVTEVK